MTKTLTPEDLKNILIQLQETDLDAIIVGGQAVNLWAYQYLFKAPELQNYLPFASEDLDFYGGKIEAVICQEKLGGELILNRDFDPSPNAGIVLVNYADRKLRIDFLASVYGLNNAEIADTALTFLGRGELIGLQLKILHPLLCLEGKLRCLRGLPQGGRQDLKHVKISIICVRQFLQEMIEQKNPRLSLKLIERLANNALREDGLSVWYHHQVDLLAAISLEKIFQETDEKWQSFQAIRWPRIIEQIQSKRERYQQVMNRITNE